MKPRRVWAIARKEFLHIARALGFEASRAIRFIEKR